MRAYIDRGGLAEGNTDSNRCPLPSKGMALEEINIQLRDGICIEAPGIQAISADAANPDSELSIVSHAHGDHLFNEDKALQKIISSELTAELAAVRNDLNKVSVLKHDDVELYESGHIAGARASLIETQAGSILYTGDVATRDRYYLNGFEPVSANILIIESTYGKPQYEFPPVEEVEKQVLDWLSDNYDQPALLFGYALGKAQKIQKLVSNSDRDRVFTTDAILNMNQIISQYKNVHFPKQEFSSEIQLGPGDVVILPSGLRKFDWVEDIVEGQKAITAGFSGWAQEQSFIYRRDLDEGFVLSDHCDFPELISLVKQVDPDVVYTQHGFSSELARELTKRGFEARALQKNQTSLGEFT